MAKLLLVEIKKVFYSRAFWILLFACCAHAILFTMRYDNMFYKDPGYAYFDLSVYNIPWQSGLKMYQFLFYSSLSDYSFGLLGAMIFAGAFIGAEFSNRSINKAIYSGYKRHDILGAKLIVFIVACFIIRFSGIIIMGINALKWSLGVSPDQIMYIVRLVVLKLFFESAMYSLVAIIAFSVRDILKTTLIPVALLTVLRATDILSLHLETIIAYPELTFLQISAIVLVSLVTLIIVFVIMDNIFRKAELK